MATTPGPKKVQRYGVGFTLKAVKVSQLRSVRASTGAGASSRFGGTAPEARSLRRRSLVPSSACPTLVNSL